MRIAQKDVLLIALNDKVQTVKFLYDHCRLHASHSVIPRMVSRRVFDVLEWLKRNDSSSIDYEYLHVQITSSEIAMTCFFGYKMNSLPKS